MKKMKVTTMRKRDNEIFAHGLNFYKLFWIFLIASIIGIIVETIWCYLTLGKIESRKGVIYGFLSPIYGYGAILMTICTSKMSKKRDLYIFLLCMVIGGVFEWVCSFVQETFLHTISWEYSNTQVNFGGRTNLLFSFCWGILGLIWVKDIYPMLSKLIERIPKKLGVMITWPLLILVVFDISISALAINRRTARFHNIKASNSFEEFLDKQYPDKKLDQIFSTMKVL